MGALVAPSGAFIRGVHAVISPSLLDELRSGTAAAHARVESRAGIERRLARPGGYASLLADLHALHAGFEDLLAAVPGPDAMPPALLRPGRARLLARDLEALGHAPAAPQPPAVRIEGTAAALGCLYVLEGSARGGAVIAAAARRRLGAGVPCDGLTGGGPAAARARWALLAATLEAFGAAVGPAERGEAVRAALGTFAAFEQRLCGAAP